MKRTKKSGLWAGLLTGLLALALILWFFTALGNIGQTQAQEGKQQLENALRRAAVACYATEGFYPPTVEYMQEHYGVQVDEELYRVFYEVHGENMMPEITVLERNDEK